MATHMAKVPDVVLKLFTTALGCLVLDSLLRDKNKLSSILATVEGLSINCS